MNEINKLNPLLEAMNNIDDSIISEAAPAKKNRARYFKPLMIAAAAAVLCGATAVTATASIATSIKTRENVVFNGKEPTDLGYDIYTDEFGWEIRTYAFKLPEYCLLDEVEGCTPVGKLRAAHTNMYGGPDDNWYLIDEEGNIFDKGVNNILVEVETTSSRGYGLVGMGILNFDYDHFGIYSSANGDNLNVSINQHTPFDSDEEES